jgi:hypothetical protein
MQSTPFDIINYIGLMIIFLRLEYLIKKIKEK